MAEIYARRYLLRPYQALHESGIEPDWVIGTSIEAKKGAIIARNPISLPALVAGGGAHAQSKSFA